MELAPDIRVIGLEGEIFSEIALAIREVFKDRFTMITGYTNGSVGYVPTPSALAEGGYEVSDSFVPEGRPGPYAANSMDIIIDSVKRLAGLTV